ncbi:MAG: hypothetical protein CVV27_13475 [Candidatus Melainabacteria bacterium HGW-Melainabacteria-1]|nr:MAG: hypothetical protein CVV27_13475 [Candidatus Melainabacteria bacterium HGW-Melainabacteria-1]
MSLSRISGSLFREEAYVLTGLPALDDAMTEQLGLTRKQVIATVSESAQADEALLASLIVHNLARDYGRKVLLLSCGAKKEFLAQAADFGRFGLDARECDEAVLRLNRQLLVENPRSWRSFDEDLANILAATAPVMILIENPDVVLPCKAAWEYVLQKRRREDPWGALARRVKGLAEQAGCPIWVFGELCYSLKFIDHLYSDMLPEAETHWRSCAQLEAYLSYWDCVIELSQDASGQLLLSSLKNRLGASFSRVPLI